jgi:CheY-like chemotaxis protein
VNKRRRAGCGEGVFETAERLRFERPLVLVVDDNEDNRELFALTVERLGYRASLARDGVEAIERATAERPDVILMDLAMPLMDGFEATRAIRSLPELHGVQILAVTASTDALSSQRALAAGCDEVLSKPVASDVLAARIRRAVLGRAEARAREVG